MKENKFLKPNVFNRIFHFKTLRRQQKEIQKQTELYKEIRRDILPLLDKCSCIQDFIEIHRKLSSKGVVVNIKLEDQENGYSPVDINVATTKHYYCGTCDRDSTYHGSQMLEFEKSPSITDITEYDYYNYIKAWGVYYRNLYESITMEECKKLHFPQWLINLR